PTDSRSQQALPLHLDDGPLGPIVLCSAGRIERDPVEGGAASIGAISPGACRFETITAVAFENEIIGLPTSIQVTRYLVGKPERLRYTLVIHPADDLQSARPARKWQVIT